jgi:signal peptidase I
MMPVINPGDVVIVAKTAGSQVKLGDIIEYRNPKENINIVHRVVEVRGEGDQKIFIAKGDNNNAPDVDPVPQQNVIGKVVFNECGQGEKMLSDCGFSVDSAGCGKFFDSRINTFNNNQ